MATEKDSNQTLLPKEDEALWLKILHGDITAAEDSEDQVDAAAIRQYLIARDEAIAANIVVDAKNMGTITPEEARIIYHRAREELRRESEKGWKSQLKNFAAPALVGGLFASIVTVAVLSYLQRDVTSDGQPSLTTGDLDHYNYQALDFSQQPGVFPNMVLIPGGKTNIGCAKGWDDASGGCRPTEFPSHAVDIKTFVIGQHEVTYGQFRKFIEATQYVTDAEKDNRGCVHEDLNAAGQPFVMNPELNWQAPGYPQNDSFPVTCVSWHDAQRYIEWLSAETNTNYRLPTEAEWEHAARGGQATAYFWGSQASSNQANYRGTAEKDQWQFAAPVGQFPANKFSVQDTSGNLWEWVEDCWHPSYQGAPNDGSAWEEGCKDPSVRVRRGGAWDMNGAGIRSAIRSPGSRHDRSNLYGFRVAKDWVKQ